MATAVTVCAQGAHAQGAPGAATSASLSLADVFRTIATQPSIAAADARLRAAAGSRTTARSLGNPLIGYQMEQASSGTAPIIERESMLMATIPLDPLYRWGPRARRAGADYRAATGDARATRQRVLLDAARAYHRVGVAQVSVTVGRELVAWLDSLVLYNAARVREGAAAESDLIRAEVERGQAGANLALMEADLARARGDLAQFLPDGLAAQPVAVVVPLRPLARPAALATGVVNPELLAARERAAAAGAGLTAERLSVIRQADAMIGTKTMGGASALVIGASLPFPLFDQNRGEIVRASGEREVARQELLGTERRIRAEVIAAQASVDALTASAVQISAPTSAGAPALLQKADDARRIALGAYREGAVPLVHLLDAARAWGEAHIAFAQLIAAQRDSVFALLESLGIDLTSTPLSVDGTSR